MTMLVSVEGIIKTIERIAKAGISCVFPNRIPDLLERLQIDFVNSLFAAVTPDPVEIGRIQGRQCLKLAPRGGFVLHVLGAPTLHRAHPSLGQDRRRLPAVAGARHCTLLRLFAGMSARALGLTPAGHPASDTDPVHLVLSEPRDVIR